MNAHKEKIVSADLVLACDGIKSPTRKSLYKQIGIDKSAPREKYAEWIAWRGPSAGILELLSAHTVLTRLVYVSFLSTRVGSSGNVHENNESLRGFSNHVAWSGPSHTDFPSQDRSASQYSWFRKRVSVFLYEFMSV
jgi:2-polyprenyl-6-methoxyphenol hydroxylase-like FAD-dependent oxidoreductase